MIAAPALLPARIAAAVAVEGDERGVRCRRPWTPSLQEYDARRFGPLLAVSDEGDHAKDIARAAYACAKARVLGATAMTVGVMIDGERMVSAGESPIGPDEYAKLVPAAFDRTFASTNVGVRANTRLERLLPEFAIADAANGEAAWLARVFAAFAPFLNTPNGVVRPLTVRLVVQPSDAAETVQHLVARLRAGRAQRLLGPASLHRFALLSITPGPIVGGAPVGEIERVLEIAERSRVTEVAIDGDLTQAARERESVASLLNVVDVQTLRVLFAAARQRRVRLVYRYSLDVDTTARTIWTGLHTARSYGFSVGKYGLLPLTLKEQERVVTLVSRWTKGWTTIPAFYLDTPLVTADDVFYEGRIADGAALWMERVRAAGARLVLFDCPDPIAARTLVRDSEHPSGVLRLEQIVALNERATELGLMPLWSGGLTPRFAFALGARRVFGIFCTGAAARKVAVFGNFVDDPDLASEIAPTEPGVRRVHAALQAGFLATMLRGANPSLAQRIAVRAQALLSAIDAKSGEDRALAELDAALVAGWKI
ncbi:MAG: hypothetical protein ACREMP_04885 [Candidatus Tyrphobacter sp.]